MKKTPWTYTIEDYLVACDYVKEKGLGMEEDAVIIRKALQLKQSKLLRYLRKVPTRMVNVICSQIPSKLVLILPVHAQVKVFRYETIKELFKFLKIPMTKHSNSPWIS